MINSFAGAKASSCKSANQRRQSARRWGKVIKGHVTQSTRATRLVASRWRRGDSIDFPDMCSSERDVWIVQSSDKLVRSCNAAPLKDDVEQKESNFKRQTQGEFFFPGYTGSTRFLDFIFLRNLSFYSDSWDSLKVMFRLLQFKEALSFYL